MKKAITGLEILVVVYLVTSFVSIVDYYDITKKITSSIMEEKK